MDRKANQEKALAAYRERQQRIATLLSKIRKRQIKHTVKVGGD